MKMMMMMMMMMMMIFIFIIIIIIMTSFPALTLLFVQNTLVHIIKRKLHGGLKISISFSRGKKQYFTTRK